MGELPIHQYLKQLSSIDLLWDYDAVSLYPSAISDEKPIFAKIETGYAFTKDMKVEIVKKFDEGYFTQRNAILKNK